MKVLLFARARDLLGVDSIEIEAAPTIGALRRRIVECHPRLADLLAKSAFAINDEYADDGAAIPLGAEVALLPPVSGG